MAGMVARYGSKSLFIIEKTGAMDKRGSSRKQIMPSTS
jgi:hypothetical protein